MSDKTPLRRLQDEAAAMVRAGGSGTARENLDAFLVRAFDQGMAAMRELSREIGQAQTEPHYIVSYEADRIVSCEEDDTVSHYQTPEDAGDDILNGVHGETGTRYVLRVETSVAAVYDRGWTMVRKTD